MLKIWLEIKKCIPNKQNYDSYLGKSIIKVIWNGFNVQIIKYVLF